MSLHKCWETPWKLCVLKYVEKIDSIKQSTHFCKYLPNKSSDIYEILNQTHDQGVFFFATSCGYAFCMKYFLWENLCFHKTTHNWNIMNIFHIDFKSVYGKYLLKFSKYHSICSIIKVLVSISCGLWRFPVGNTRTPAGKKTPCLRPSPKNGHNHPLISSS